MGSVLDQSEVDALLAAVDEGEVTPATLEKAVSGEAASTITLYDWKRPERVSKDQMRSLENFHEVFARNMGASLSAFLRTIIDVKLASVEQLTYSEFIMSLPNPTCFNLLSAKPLEGQMILEINPSIIFPIIDRLLGGGKESSPAPDRPLTEIELRIVEKIIHRALEELKKIWARIKQIDFALEEMESNPQLRQIVPPNEVVVLVSFEISMGDATGSMNLCIPFMVVEPIMSAFAIQNLFAVSRGHHAASNVASIREGLADSRVEAVAFLAETSLTPRDILNLKPGDVLPTTKPSDGTLLLTVQGRPKFRGTPVLSHGKRALRVVSAAGMHDHI